MCYQTMSHCVMLYLLGFVLCHLGTVSRGWPWRSVCRLGTIRSGWLDWQHVLSDDYGVLSRGALVLSEVLALSVSMCYRTMLHCVLLCLLGSVLARCGGRHDMLECRTDGLCACG